MKIAVKNNDYLEINGKNLEDTFLDKKYHLIKLDFDTPDKYICNIVLDKFKTTNRYIISNNIAFYNTFFKTTNKKYYVENTINDVCILKFLKKNNKILLNFETLHNIDLVYTLTMLEYILPLVEVIKISSERYKLYKNVLENWSGDVILE